MNNPENRAVEVIRDERGRFRPGACPNPGGRSRSDLEVAALLARLTPRALEILGERMEEGDVVAAREITRLGIAPPKSRPVRVALAPLLTAQDCLAAFSRIAEAVSSAEITPSDAAPLIGLVQAAQTLIEGSELESRLAAIESRLREGNLDP